MKQAFLFACLCNLAWSVALPSHAAQPWLSAVGQRTVICCSPKTEPEVRLAAEQVLAELKRTRADAVLLDPDSLATDYATLGTNHVICVGQWADNQVLRMTWGHWANLRQQREWQAKGDQRAMELTKLWPKDIPPQAWRWRHDLFAFGYGDFDGGDVGYVQTVRTSFPELLRTVPEQTEYNVEVPRPFDRTPQNQMYFVTDLTGTGPAGVVKAVDAFLRDALLNGVAPGAAKPMLADWTLQGLGPKQLAADLPAWAPVADLPAGVKYLGQQMAGSHLYGGVCEASGIRPERMWRLKYGMADGFRFFDSYPTNRASGNELLIAAYASEDKAKAAAAALRKDLPAEPPVGTWEHGGHSYALYGNTFKGWHTWAESKRFCEKLGGHLITIGSQGEQNALAKAMEEASIKIVFIGLSGDWQKNKWAWVTGEPLSHRGFRKANGEELYARMGRKGSIGAHELKMVPTGPHEPVKFTTFPNPGWYVDERTIEAFVCEWDEPSAARRQTAARTRVATRGQYVLMQSFDDLAGEAILQKATGQ